MFRAARERKLPVPDPTVTAAVGIGRKQTNRFGLTVSLQVSIPNMERSEAEALVRAAHEDICPYSQATRGNIDVSVTVV
jgi:osmotically inducible protein OsmC